MYIQCILVPPFCAVIQTSDISVHLDFKRLAV